MSEKIIDLRVRYAETDQMGFAHHANYLIWCELARTSLMRDQGVSYRELEESGLFLPVVDAHITFRSPARFDDLVQVRCWVRELRSRRVDFGYQLKIDEENRVLATATTRLIAMDKNNVVTTIPDTVRELLTPIDDPVRI